MRLIFKFFLLAICLLQSITFSLGTSFLLYPQSAYELALGSHPSLGGSESVNPSLIKQKNASPIFYMNSGSWLGDISLTGLNYVHKVGSYNNRLFLRQADVSDLEFRGDSPSDDPISKFSAYAFQLGSGISRASRFGNFGIMFSYLSMGIYDQNADGFLFDIGYSKSLDNGFGMGFAILNLGSMSSLYKERPKLPTMISAGISKHIELFNLKNKIYLTAESSTKISPTKFKLGADIYWSSFHFLTGYSMTKHDTEFSIGGGFKYGRLGIMYATKIGTQEIGAPKILSIIYTIL